MAQVPEEQRKSLTANNHFSLARHNDYFKGGYDPNDAAAQLYSLGPTHKPLPVSPSGPKYLPLYFTLTFPSNQVFRLAMYVNPTSMNIKMAHKITREQTIAGWAEFHWGEELTGISCEAVTGAFQDPETGMLMNPFGDAYFPNGRQDSPAWKHFNALLRAFQSNGVVWFTEEGEFYNWREGDNNTPSRPLGFPNPNKDQHYQNFSGYVKETGTLTMDYDGRTYPGYFESFSFKENEAQPYMLTFSFEFKAVNYHEEAVIPVGNVSGWAGVNDPAYGKASSRSVHYAPNEFTA